ncbi:MAG: hypothetical protein A2161_01225 [Candidatus Schekmanbacteria bacterium RBG_13_48_7]|uniref:VapC45 PIN like domain-containing protein n=1 Tax=Candidatus Schekmanbacteria bacterium RBG_13_48_7 TaxID=1817878 RepID=A0A1F7RZ34_9BACT|nr:MAG: hypothetical protein A2161_01225 [Candidatus Schekmanbacteria bacterium RBG_13_48_7]
MKLKFFMDNNLSPRLARGMTNFRQNIMHLRDRFPQNADDEDWLEFAGQNSFFVLTRNTEILKTPAQLDALVKFNVGTFFMGGGNLNICDTIKQLIRNWQKIKEYAANTNRPFAFRVPASGSNFADLRKYLR